MEVILGRSSRFATTLAFSPMFLTKNCLESSRFIRSTDPRHWKFKLIEKYPRYRNLSSHYVPLFNRITTRQLPNKYNINKSGISIANYCKSKQDAKDGCPRVEVPENLSVFAKMKMMTKSYWHILVPVHIVTSIGWLAIFYVTVKNGVDIVKVMEFLRFNEKYLDMVRNSGAGDWALMYAMYKIFTPLRYTVTIGLTTMVIRRLSKLGLVKPLPFGRQVQTITKTNEPSKTHKTTFKAERETEPPKT